MKVAIGIHWGTRWEGVDVPEATTLEEAAKAAVLRTHTFLNKEEYPNGWEMETVDLGPEYGNAKYAQVYHLPRTEAPPQAAITPAMFRKYAGDPWFSVQYCDPAEVEIERWVR